MPDPAADRSVDRPVPTSSRPVMVVDDDRLVLLTLSHGLRQAGIDVIEADNGDDAILLARERAPALALLDIRMQGLSGFDVAQHLKDYSLIPFVFISAYADEATQDTARALGAWACLSKPVDVAQLLPWVHRALMAPHAEQSMNPAGVVPQSADLDPVALAVGLIMQAASLGPHEALQRLHEQARSGHLSLTQAAQAALARHTGALGHHKASG